MVKMSHMEGKRLNDITLYINYILIGVYIMYTNESCFPSKTKFKVKDSTICLYIVSYWQSMLFNLASHRKLFTIRSFLMNDDGF